MTSTKLRLVSPLATLSALLGRTHRFEMLIPRALRTGRGGITQRVEEVLHGESAFGGDFGALMTEEVEVCVDFRVTGDFQRSVGRGRRR